MSKAHNDAIEKAATWHDEQRSIAKEQESRAQRDGFYDSKAHWKAKAEEHEHYAAAIRALKVPETEGEPVAARLKRDFMESEGEGLNYGPSDVGG